MRSGLAALAIELVELIAGTLDRGDLISLRLVCKELNTKTLYSFRHTCFRTFSTDFSRASMQKLENIASSEGIRHHVQTLRVIIDPTVWKLWADDFGGGPFPHGHDSGCLESTHLGAQRVRDILVERLVNCRSFHLQGHDEGNCHFFHIGYGELFDNTFDCDHLTCSDYLAMVLAIISEASLPVKSFWVDFRGPGRLDVKRLQFPVYQQPAFRCGWAHLQELYLEHGIAADQIDWVVDLISHAPTLQKLSLTFQSDACSTDLINRLIIGHELPALQYLKLFCARVTVKQMSGLLMASRNSLRELFLRHCYVRDGGPWVTFFRELAKYFLLLESINFVRLTEYGTFAGNCVHYPTLLDNPIVPGSKVTSFPERSEFRLLQPLQLPAKLIWKPRHGIRWAVGIKYRGPQVDAVLNMMADLAQVGFSVPANDRIMD
ncbi:MAG: hypothetical protein Q9163_002647 [Psora crenata]